MVVVQSYGGLLATRFLLGFAEAGIFPGSMQTPRLLQTAVLTYLGFYLISFWYKREEAQKRFTFYWCSVLLATAFGGLLASAIANMDGVGGYSNWRWIFILEGLVTIIIGVTAFFTVADFPENSKWLTAAEKQFLLDQNTKSTIDVASSSVKVSDVLVFFKDIRNVIGGIIYFCKCFPRLNTVEPC